MGALAEFRAEARAWIEENLPPGLRGASTVFNGGRKTPTITPDSLRWAEVCYERGYTAPTWPKEYGGAGMTTDEQKVLREEMLAANAPLPLGGHGLTMIGPTLLEYGTEDQKSRHLPNIASGTYRWCQGYSEPNSGSDLASLQTRADDHGDHYLVNGSKIWTTGAHYADWMFCLVRTNFDVPKWEGISMVLFPMSDPGITVKTITLINGSKEFCQCFFDDVVVPKIDLVHRENQGWAVGKRLLQHERMPAAQRTAPPALDAIAKRYVGEADGKIGDAATREDVLGINMDVRALQLTQRRAAEEREGATPTFVTSMFKYYNSELVTRHMETLTRMCGTQGLGWEGAAFTDEELANTRAWLRVKAGTIAAGSSEIQLNIIAKRVLGLPD